MCSDPTTMRRDGPAAWSIVSKGVGCLLVGAAILKASSPVESITLHSVYHLPQWLVAVAVQIEVSLGVALLSNASPHWVRRVTLAAFVIFTSFSALRAVGGAESCGCFGPIKVNPWWTLGLDVVVLVVLSLIKPETDHRSPRSTRLAFVSYATLGGLCLALAVLIAPSGAQSNPLLKDAGGITLLEPEEWTGQPFPLGKFIEPSPQLSVGEWDVLLYHHDCPKCQAARPKYEALALRHAKSGGPSVLLVEVPPYGPEQGARRDNYAKLTDNHKWFVQAPVEITLRDGVVTDASLDLPSIQHAHP